MWRYVRLYAFFIRFSFSRAMEFRLDFFFRIVMDSLFYVVQLAFFWLVYRHTSLLGNWTLDQMIVFTSAYLLVDALNMTIFSNNLWWFPLFVNRGDLDYYLTRPVSSLFFMSLRDFAANSFINLVIASSIMTWALARYPGELGAGSIVLFVALVFLGSLIFSMLCLIFLIPVFWIHSANGLRETFYQLSRYSERPHQIFGGFIRRILLTVLPLAMVASMPTHVLFEGLNAERAALIVSVSAGTFLFLVWFWNRGLRAYASASS